MKLNEIIKQLKERGFEVKYQDILDGEVIGLDLYNSIEKHIRLETEYDAEYIEEIKKLPIDAEYEIDFSRMNCIGAFFECDIDYPEGPRCAGEEEQHGILLGENYVDYCWVDYFWTAFEAFENPTNFSRVVMKAHLEHLNYFYDNIRPILCKYDFINNFDSFFYSGDKAHLGSTPTFSYKYTYSNTEQLTFWTDPISLEFKGTINPYSSNFEEELKKWMHWEPGDVKICFERFFTNDVTYTPTSYRDICAILYSIRAMEGVTGYHLYSPEEIDFNNIPISRKEIIEEYYKLYNRRNETI